MKGFKHLNEQDEVYSEAHAKELLQIKANYNRKIQELNNQLAKQTSDLAVKYMKIAQAQQQLAQTQKVAAKVAGTQQPKPTVQTGYVNSAGMPVNATGSPTTTQESYEGILKIKEIINEDTFDINDVDIASLQDLKDYMDAENISYIENEDETTIDFDKEQLDPEWQDELERMGLDPVDNVETDDIIDMEDEDTFDDEEYEDDAVDTQKEIDNDKVFYVKIRDDEGDFTGKIYKLFDDGDWRAKVVDGDSKTFEKLNYDPDWDDIDIIAFLRENYDDAELIGEDEFNDHVEEPEVESEIQESHKIQTFEEFLNETR